MMRLFRNHMSTNRAMRNQRAARRRRAESGFVTVEFVAGLGFLILPTIIFVTVISTWSERVSMARVASREAARTYVLTKDPAQAAAIVSSINSNYHMPDNTLTLTMEGDPSVRGGKVTATVSTKIPLTAVPLLGFNKDVITHSEKHTEIVDLYRSAS